MKRGYKITLEEQQQDVVELITDHAGKVISCLQPAFIGAWIPVQADDMMQVGKLCPIHCPPTINYGFLKYKIEKIERI